MLYGFNTCIMYEHVTVPGNLHLVLLLQLYFCVQLQPMLFKKKGDATLGVMDFHWL